MIDIFCIFLIIFMFVCAYTATHVKELISAVLLMGAFGFFLAIIWSLLAAPDVSFTEAMVGTGASSIFMLLALFGSNHHCKNNDYAKFPWFPLLIIVSLGALFIWASGDLPLQGNPDSIASTHLSPHYLMNAYKETKTPNAVTAVVVDYRGFDTLVECAVVFTAGLACMLIMKKGRKDD